MASKRPNPNPSASSKHEKEEEDSKFSTYEPDEEEEDDSDSASHNSSVAAKKKNHKKPKSMAFTNEAQGSNLQLVLKDASKSENSKRQRLWSAEDEIVLLSKLSEYVAEKGTNQINDWNSFLEFIKNSNSIQFDFTKRQLQHKIQKLRGKYNKKVSKGVSTFLKEHEQTSYDLSKQIWGNHDDLLAINSNTIVHTNIIIEKEPNNSIVHNHRMFLLDKSMEEFVMDYGLDFVKESKRALLEEKWKKLHKAQLQLYVEQTHLVYRQAKLILKSLDAPDLQ